MSRRMPLAQSLFGPGACCDACARPKWDMGGEGSLCYWCRRGVFMHRRFWRFTFEGEAFVCATPRDDVDDAAMQQEWLALAAQQRRGGYAVPEPLQRAIDSIDAGNQASGCTSSAPLLRGAAASRVDQGAPVIGWHAQDASSDSRGVVMMPRRSRSGCRRGPTSHVTSQRFRS